MKKSLFQELSRGRMAFDYTIDYAKTGKARSSTNPVCQFAVHSKPQTKIFLDSVEVKTSKDKRDSQ
jgi:hypothetical protein